MEERIYELFLQCRNNTSPNRQISIGQLWDHIIKWHGKKISIEKYEKGYELGKEVYHIIRRITKEGSNIPQDKEGFFKYLITALKRGKYEYIRQYKKRNQEDIIRMKESFLGRKLTEEEKISFINKWYNCENAMKVISTSLTDSEKEAPYTEYLNTDNTAIIIEAIKTVLSGKQERSRDCYRALLTLHWIDYVDLYHALDSRVVEACRQRAEKPKPYEIYQIYHPKASKRSSEVMASNNLKELLSDLKVYLKEKNPEIFHQTH